MIGASSSQIDKQHTIQLVLELWDEEPVTAPFRTIFLICQNVDDQGDGATIEWIDTPL